MNKFPLVVSYYTKETVYQLEVQNLIASCENWGIEHHIEPITSLGSWERNCCYKPFFLMEKLQQFKRPLFWVDADGVFVRKPEWQTVFSKDAAVRINAEREDRHPSKVNSGSLYINATVGGGALLQAWAQECLDCFADPNRSEEIWDQIAMRDVILRGNLRADIGLLPLEYLKIIGNPCDEKNIGEAVVAHYQASRRFKKIINTG